MPGELFAYDQLISARSKHAEAQARFKATPWSSAVCRDLDAAEARLSAAVDAYIKACGGNYAPRKVF